MHKTGQYERGILRHFRERPSRQRNTSFDPLSPFSNARFASTSRIKYCSNVPVWEAEQVGIGLILR